MQTEFSERLIKYRENARLSVSRLASLLGAPETSVAAWESGSAVPDETQKASLCRVYGVTPDQLVYLDPDELTGDAPSAPAANETPSAAEGPVSPERFNFRDRTSKYLRAIPLALAALGVFLLLGFAFDLWHPAWLLFMLVPVIYSVCQAVSSRSVRKFNYPVLITATYLFVGFTFGLWHPAWVMMLTIPVFYLIF